MDDLPPSTAPASAPATSHAHDAHHDDHGHEEHKLGFWRSYVFSTDHKVIGIQYLISGFIYLYLGFILILLMRWQLAYPGEPLTIDNLAVHLDYKLNQVSYALTGEQIDGTKGAPIAPDPTKPIMPAKVVKSVPATADHPAIIGTSPWPLELRWSADSSLPHLWVNPCSWLELFFGTEQMPNGVMTGDFYNSLGAMHGTIMVFLGIVPIAFAGFGNYVMPLQLGAPDMTFPRLNMLSFQFFTISALLMFGSFFLPGGAAKSGWTSYSPLAEIADPARQVDWGGFLGVHSFTWPAALSGQSIWLIGMVFNITASLLGSVNFIATIIQLRTKGMTWMRMPFFCWTQFMTAFLLLLAFPPLEAAGAMQLVDRIFGGSIFMPTGLVVGGQPAPYAGGGTPILWQHLFWFLGHPEVYVLILPGLGIITEIVANNSRKPIWGYTNMVYGLFVLGFLSMIVWAHHMYLTGMGTAVSSFFQLTTIIISVPTILVLTSILISLWGGSIRFTVPMLWATAFLPLFGIGGLTGIPLAFNAPDTYLHDTYYIIAHFHYVIAPGTMFALFAGVVYWYPKATGRMMNEFWGKVHFWPTMVLMNCIFFPMFLQGMAGMHRRMYDGGATYDILNKNVLHWNEFISQSAWLMALVQIPFILNFLLSWKYGRRVSDNPWEATTLEWSAPTPPPHGNFATPPTVYRSAYEYSVPGAEKDFTPQTEPPQIKQHPMEADGKLTLVGDKIAPATI